MQRADVFCHFTFNMKWQITPKRAAVLGRVTFKIQWSMCGGPWLCHFQLGLTGHSQSAEVLGRVVFKIKLLVVFQSQTLTGRVHFQF